MKINLVFNISLLKRATEDLLARQVIPPSTSIEVEGEEEYEFEKNLSSRIYQKRFECLVKWMRYEQPHWLDSRDLNELEAVD